jgi:hypothetical protein
LQLPELALGNVYLGQLLGNRRYLIPIDSSFVPVELYPSHIGLEVIPLQTTSFNTRHIVCYVGIGKL